MFSVVGLYFCVCLYAEAAAVPHELCSEKKASKHSKRKKVALCVRSLLIFPAQRKSVCSRFQFGFL